MKPGMMRWKREFLYHSAFTLPLPRSSPAPEQLAQEHPPSEDTHKQKPTRAQQAEVVGGEWELFVEKLGKRT
jgi:hypothetical protein